MLLSPVVVASDLIGKLKSAPEVLRIDVPDCIRSEKLPTHSIIKYKRIFAKKALKATYNGNYITSDRAWYTLMKKAEDLGKEVELTPIEYFYNNPNFGGNEINWKAEIFMPIE